MKKIWLLILPLLICGAGEVRAEEKIKIEEVVVTATKVPEPLEETTSSVIVIKEEEIKKMNVHFVPDVFRQIPALNVVQNGGDGKLTSVFLRGGAPTNTLVLIDGIKVTSPTAGVFDFSSIPVDAIERIEIVEGPQSTVYGSEAMAGVINIITKKGEGKPGFNVVLEGGAFGTYKSTLEASGSVRALNYRITTSYFNTEGISAAKDGTERDGYKNALLSWKLGIKPSENSELELFGHYYYDRSQLDGFDLTTRRAVDALSFVQHANHFLLAARSKLYLLDKWEQILTLSTFRDVTRFRDPDTEFNNADVVNRRQIADWQNNFYLSNAATLTAGVEYRLEKGENKGNYTESVDNKAGYVNSKLKLLNDSLVINAGLRYDKHETAGSKVTYRAGAAYIFKEAGLTIRGSYGTGFRAPSLDELFFPFFGNPLLKPEESKGFEAGIEKSLLKDRLVLSLTYFRQNYDNLIQADPLTFTAANIAKAEIKGVEANARFKLTDAVSLKAGYTNLDTLDRATGQSLTRRPNDKVNIGVGYTGPDLSAWADLLYVGRRLDTAAQRDLSSYAVVNLSGSYRVKKCLTLFGRVENLFNKHYEEAGGFGTKGASVYGGLRVTM